MISYDRHEEVQSSNLKEIGTVGDYLVAVFRNGSIYRYPGLAHEMDNVVTATSIGGYFAKNIRNQSCERLHSDDWPD